MDSRQVALTLLKGVSGRPLSAQEIDSAASHFAEGPTSIDAPLFVRLFNTLIAQLDEHPAMRRLARRYSARLNAPHFETSEAAERFIRRYIDALDPQLFLATGITAGYAQRGALNSYETVAGRSVSTDYWTLIFTLEGKGVLDIGTRKHSLVFGDLVLFEPGAAPLYYPDRGSNIWGHYWLVFQDVRHWKPWLQLPKLSAHTLHVRADRATAEAVEKAFSTLCRCLADGSSVSNDLANNLVEQIILHGCTLATASTHIGCDQRITKAQSYIEENFSKSFTLKDVAEHVNLSVAGLARLFKQETGTTVLNWRDEKRMMTSVHLLEHTELSIGAIADSVGYADSNFFATKFRTMFDCSPTQYRKSHQ